MIDLHVHLLPGIDDGAADLAEAVRMCRLARADGCHTLVATPHQRHRLWENRDRAGLEELRQRVQEEAGGEPRLLLGAEIRIDAELVAEVEQLPDGDLLPLAGSRYLLLEPSRGALVRKSDLLALSHELAVAGRVPVFAHPELIHGLGEDLPLARELTAAGALFQLTAMSVTGDFGRRPRGICDTLLDEGLVHFVASDAHGSAWRPPGLGRARERIARYWGEETARRLTEQNPAAVVEDRPLDDPPSEP